MRNVNDVQKVAAGTQDSIPNLTVAEIQTLEKLSHRRDIIIKPDDEGSVIFLTDTSVGDRQNIYWGNPSPDQNVFNYCPKSISP